jgi:hypothetical protein
LFFVLVLLPPLLFKFPLAPSTRPLVFESPNSILLHIFVLLPEGIIILLPAVELFLSAHPMHPIIVEMLLESLHENSYLDAI